MYLEDERRERIVVIVCEKRETIKKKIRKIDILMKCNVK